jgi:hypothetical protein
MRKGADEEHQVPISIRRQNSQGRYLTTRDHTLNAAFPFAGSEASPTSLSDTSRELFDNYVPFHRYGTMISSTLAI